MHILGGCSQNGHVVRICNKKKKQSSPHSIVASKWPLFRSYHIAVAQLVQSFAKPYCRSDHFPHHCNRSWSILRRPNVPVNLRPLPTCSYTTKRAHYIHENCLRSIVDRHNQYHRDDRQSLSGLAPLIWHF